MVTAFLCLVAAPHALASVPHASVVRTLSLRNVAPSVLAQQLIDPTAQHPLTEGLERLSPDDSRKTLTLSGPLETVKRVEQAVRWLDVHTPQVELMVEVMELPGKPLEGRVLVNHSTRGSLTLSGRQSLCQLLLAPHLNRDGSCSLAVSVAYNKFRGEGELPKRITTSGITTFRRVALGKPLELGLASVEGIELDATEGGYWRKDKDQPPTLRVRITPRLKK
jgi:hypothetical protein